MQSVPLDILILGLLVILFASILRKRASARLRLWIAGWLFILVHFAARLFHPASAAWLESAAVLADLSLVFCATCFILSTAGVPGNWHQASRQALGLSVAAILFYWFRSNYPSTQLIQILLFAAIQLIVLRIVWTIYQRLTPSVLVVLAACCASTVWGIDGLRHPGTHTAFHSILALLYLVCAVLYRSQYRRITTGSMTVVAGLVTWAFVFPISALIEGVYPGFSIESAIWNVPKYFVAFGMLITLLEDEILSANRATRQYRLLFETNPHPMWITDEVTRAFLAVNDAAVHYYGYSREQFLNMTEDDLRPAHSTPDEADPETGPRTGLQTTPRVSSGSTGIETENFGRSGLSDIALQAHALSSDLDARSQATVTTHMTGNGGLIRVNVASNSMVFEGRNCQFSLIVDITEQQRLHEQLKYQAFHDSLTGLPNRLLLEDRMQQTFARAARSGYMAAVLCIDLDRFKQVNDTFGHMAGDLCLTEVARRLTARLRIDDTVARTGGEEFVVVLGKISAAADAEMVAQSILVAVCEPFQFDGQSIAISASLGIAIYPINGTDSEQLWRDADSAMYVAKRSGGNQYLCVSREISAAVIEANDLEHHIRLALRDCNPGSGRQCAFEMHYQPQFTIAGQLSGMEALMRLRHPVLGLIYPDRFIHIAEKTGLIIPLGNWAIEEVCRQSIAWRRQGMFPVRIAVNVSSLQFQQPDFSTRVMDILSSFCVDPSLLELELTETIMMQDVEESVRQMKLLTQHGILFSIDDFGSGYSSLSHLHRLPIATLKIERSFIHGLSSPENNTYPIVQAIISLAHSLGMRVIAEGVETQLQLDVLNEIGCDAVQGFFFSPAIPAAEIPAQVASGFIPQPAAS